jgi:hypothetical protein
MFTLRPLQLGPDGRVTAADFARFAPWWTARGGDSPTREMLPGCGVAVEWNPTPVAVAFLYLDATGSGMAWLAWLATCPDTSAHRTGRAMRHALRYLVGHAASLNYWCVAATYHHPALVKLLKRMGFKTGDRGMTQLFLTI